MRAERFDLRGITPQAWKNGAGLTREIARGGGDADSFDWRFSLAEVERDAPFSAFPGIDRCIVLLRGAGMCLRSGDGAIDHRLTQPLAPFHFPGDTALDAALIDGACSDFNVMTRRGVFRSTASVHRDAGELAAADITLLLCCDGEWRVAAETLRPLQALLWRALPPAVISVRPVHDSTPASLLLVCLWRERGA